MSELRKDYILDRWVCIASGRKKRPREIRKEEKHSDDSKCFFCPGMESETPPEIGRWPEKGEWHVRWFENKFPAVDKHGDAVSRTDNRFFTFGHAFGHHEVLVETRDHSKQLHDLTADQIAQLLRVYSSRIDDLGRDERIKYVQVFKNHGPMAGTSILHSHSQLIALPLIPKSIRDEISAVNKFVQCPYCRIIEEERKGVRFCFENSDVIAFCPYASRYNYEVWIFPKEHIISFDEIPFLSFADILKKVLVRLSSISNISYNYALHYSPFGELHVHVEVYPEISIWGGFERGSGMVINTVSPEDAAAFYRGEL